jgi:site-specific DNA recombinase
MNIRLDFDREQVHLDLGDLFQLTQQLVPSGPVAEWQEILNAMRDSGVAGAEINGEDIHLTLKGA